MIWSYFRENHENSNVSNCTELPQHLRVSRIFPKHIFVQTSTWHKITTSAGLVPQKCMYLCTIFTLSITELQFRLCNLTHSGSGNYKQKQSLRGDDSRYHHVECAMRVCLACAWTLVCVDFYMFIIYYTTASATVRRKIWEKYMPSPNNHHHRMSPQNRLQDAVVLSLGHVLLHVTDRSPLQIWCTSRFCPQDTAILSRNLWRGPISTNSLCWNNKTTYN